MRTDRLYAITVFLLNHGKTSASELAKKFEVSVRTIQRDIDSLCEAGIPIAAETGATGGYYLTDSFRMDAQTATEEEYSYILTALKGYSTAMGSPRIDSAIEKIASLAKQKDDSVVLDFSVLREVDNSLMQALQEAIRRKKAVRFNYTNAENIVRTHTVEPIAVVYRWYAWYLLAYSTVKGDYRTYKLVRMNGLEITEADFSKEHDSTDKVLKESSKSNAQETIEIKICCKPEARAKAIEYLNGKITAEYNNGECDMSLYVIETEHLWFGTILSLGDGVVIKEPEHIRQRILDAAEKIVALYK